MKTSVKHKMYMGLGRFMIPISQLISGRGLRRGVSSAKQKADLLSEEERTIHHLIVKKMAVSKKPITAECIGEEVDVPLTRIEETLDKLEALKTFLYRSDGKAIHWAYPLSLENTGHHMSASTGERFFAA